MPQIQKRKKNKESAQNMKNIIQMSAFLQNCKNPETEIFVFYVMTFDPITCYAPQNDRLNLSFMRDM